MKVEAGPDGRNPGCPLYKEASPPSPRRAQIKRNTSLHNFLPDNTSWPRFMITDMTWVANLIF